MIDPFYEQTEVLAREDIADDVAYMVTPPAPRRHRRAMDHAHRTALTASARPARSRRRWLTKWRRRPMPVDETHQRQEPTGQ
jgi:hypothetical protein